MVSASQSQQKAFVFELSNNFLIGQSAVRLSNHKHSLSFEPLYLIPGGDMDYDYLDQFYNEYYDTTTASPEDDTTTTADSPDDDDDDTDDHDGNDNEGDGSESGTESMYWGENVDCTF